MPDEPTPPTLPRLRLVEVEPPASGLRRLWRAVWGVDTSCDDDRVPKPPKTSRTDHGEEMPGWGASIVYRTGTDDLEVTTWREDTLRRRGRIHREVLPYSDFEDAVTRVQRYVRILSARRLF